MTRYVLLEIEGLPEEADVDVLSVLQECDVGDIFNDEDATVSMRELPGRPLPQGGMGAYQWCHDCETRGVPFPVVRELGEHGWDGFRCGNCGSGNVIHYEAVFERRNGEVTVRPRVPVSSVHVGGGVKNGELEVLVEVADNDWRRVFQQDLILDQENVGVISHFTEALGIAKRKTVASEWLAS